MAAAQRCRALSRVDPDDLASKLERAEERGDLDASSDTATALWRAEPGHPVAFRVLAAAYRSKFGGDHIDDVLEAVTAYRERIGWQSS